MTRILRALVLAASVPINLCSASAQTATTFKLDNGLEIAVIEDRRAPIVTHFIGYRSGGADDPQGKSGAAHFVEHLMFSAAPQSQGRSYAAEFARLGGRTNAVTTHDSTLYHARISKEYLPLVMQREAARMQRIEISQQAVDRERDVILAERRSRIDGRPFAALVERADALMPGSHYARPSIGIAAEIAAIDVKAVEAFHRRHYQPRNAFVVVVGDVSADHVRALARETYGRVANDDRAHREEEGHQTATTVQTLPTERMRRLTTSEARMRSATFYRAYQVPSFASSTEGEAEALEILSSLLTSRRSGRIALRLQSSGQAGAEVDGGYLGVRRSSGQMAIYVVAATDGDLAAIESAVDGVIHDLAERAPPFEEIDAARRTLIHQRAIRADDQFLLAQLYAEGLGAGVTTLQIEGYASRLARVGPDDIRKAARFLRDSATSVTAVLLPVQARTNEAAQ